MKVPDSVQTLLPRLLETQKYAVLATDNHGQPYTSLMAFSVTEDLQSFILMTERGRLKYENLIANPRVAIMIDNRENLGSDLEEAVAVTAQGLAEEIAGDALRMAGIVSGAPPSFAGVCRLSRLCADPHQGDLLCHCPVLSGSDRMADRNLVPENPCWRLMA